VHTLPPSAKENSKPFTKIIAASAAGALLVAIGIVFGQFIRHSSELDPVPVGGPFELVDQDDHAVNDKSFLGRPSVILFGYTSCPDVCPTTLMDVSNWLKAIGTLADKLNVLFISIDPERDTPNHLREFLSSFDPRIRGLTGTTKQIAAVAKEFRVYYKRVEESDGSYSMDHSGAVYLMDKAGNFVAPLSFQTEDAVAIERLRSLANS
jgi:protein SCO1/2